VQLKITTEEFQEAHYGHYIIGRTFGMSIGRVRELTRGFAVRVAVLPKPKALPARIKHFRLVY